jgi:hypothetical protein
LLKDFIVGVEPQMTLSIYLKEIVMRKFLMFLVIASAAANAHGQQCEGVIALSKVVSAAVQDKTSVEQNAARFCSEYSRSTDRSSSSSFGASYKFLSGSFAGGNASVEAVASKYCSASSNFSESRDAYKQYIESISPNAYNAYQQCLIMSTQDVKFVAAQGKCRT